MTKSYQIYTKVKKGWRGQSSTKIDYIYQLNSINWFGHTLHEMPLLQWLIWLLRAKASSNLVFNKAVARLGCPRTKRHPSVQECTQVIQFFQVSLLSSFAPAYPAIKPCLSPANFGIPENVTKNVTENVQKRTFIFLVIVVRSLSVRNKNWAEEDKEKKKKKKEKKRRKKKKKTHVFCCFDASEIETLSWVFCECNGPCWHMLKHFACERTTTSQHCGDLQGLWQFGFFQPWLIGGLFSDSIQT